MKGLKLSEAIRAGSKQHEASEVGWDDRHPTTGKIRTCTMVAALVAEGLLEDNGGSCLDVVSGRIGPAANNRTNTVEGFTMVVVRNPLRWRKVTSYQTLPPCPCKQYGIQAEAVTIITHLHDIHRWSREATAEWVETIEKKLETEKPKSEPAPEAVVDNPVDCAV